jgi:hypothetical protein
VVATMTEYAEVTAAMERKSERTKIWIKFGQPQKFEKRLKSMKEGIRFDWMDHISYQLWL